MAESLLPPALRWAGPLLAPLYGLGVCAHRAFTTPRKAPLPVLCVGNLTVGGTGKTPAAKYFARGLVERGRRPAVLMRGYREQASDEGREVENAVKTLGVPVLIGGDRLASVLKARERGCDCVLLDDGFQHWRLARDLDIVLIDATQPFGGGRLVPWGRLREPLSGLRRAGVVILTRSDLIPPEALAALQRELAERAPQAVRAAARHAPAHLLDLHNAEAREVTALKGLEIEALCGLGNPDGFVRTLQALGAGVRGVFAFRDHLNYDAAFLRKLPKTGRPFVVTEKDGVKIAPLLKEMAAMGAPSEHTFLQLSVAFEIIDCEENVWGLIERALANARA